jgi:Zn-dependent protease
MVTKEVKRTVKCHYCDNDVILPFKCSFCRQQFCTEHRLPENHDCPEYWQTKIPRREPQSSVINQGKPYEYTVTYAPKPTTRIGWFSPKEIRHLVVGTLLIAGIGLSFILESRFQPEILAGLTMTFTLAFLLHELSHKVQAQRLGLWAEFRLTIFGVLITLISIFLPFKIVSPGAVMIAGPASREIAGKTAIAGPLTNIVLSSLLLLSFFYLHPPLSVIAIWGAAFNAWIALVNLLPFGMLDGLKVFWWNKLVWSIAFVVSGVLAVITYVIIY